MIYSKILVMADIAWKPNDNEMENIKFDDYKFKQMEKMNKTIIIVNNLDNVSKATRDNFTIS